MDARNFLFLFYGLAAAWTILAGYVVYLGARERGLKRQLDNLRRMVEDRDRQGGQPPGTAPPPP